MLEEIRKTQKGNDLGKILLKNGIKRLPKNSEILAFSVAQLFKKGLQHQAQWQTKLREQMKTSDFRIGSENAVIPLVDRLFNIVLTETPDERDGNLTKEASATKALRRLHLHSIRLKLLGNNNTTLLHKAFTQIFSVHQSKELLTYTTKLGTTQSYNKDYSDNVSAKEKLESSRKNLLQLKSKFLLTHIF